MSSSAKPSFEGLYPSFQQLETKDLQMVVLLSHLLIMARKKKVTSYRTPAQAMSMFSAGLGGHLEELFKLNCAQGEPLYGALVVNKESQMPSEGFFEAAIRYKLADSFPTEEEKKAFWSKQVDRVFASTVSDDLKDLLSGLSESQKRDLEILLRNKSLVSEANV